MPHGKSKQHNPLPSHTEKHGVAPSPAAAAAHPQKRQQQKGSASSHAHCTATPPLTPVKAPRPISPPPQNTTTTTTAAHGDSNNSYGGASPMLNLRHMYDLLKLTAAENKEKAAAYLHMEDELRGDNNDNSSSGGGGGSPEARRQQGLSTPASISTGGGGAAGGGSGSTATAPSQALVIAAISRLEALVATADAQLRRDRQGGGSSGGLPSADKIVLLAKLVAWFCLETAGESATFSNIGAVGGGMLSRTSQNVSGRATPAVGGRGRARRGLDRLNRGRDGGGGGGRGSTSSAGGSTSRFGDWANSRLSNESFGGGGGARQLLPDDQLAEQLFRPAITLVTKLSTYCEYTSTTTSPAAPPTTTTTTTTTTATTAQSDDVRLSAIVLLAAVVARFPEADFHSTAFLPMLFPGEDVRKGSGNRHPLLTPLVWDSSRAVRGAASVLLVLLLYKMQRSLQYAEEPKRRQQSFESLSTQSGAALMSIHDTLLWVLKLAGHPQPQQQQQQGGQKGNRSGGSAKALPAPPPAALDKKTGLLHVYSSAVVVTPYNRCPHCLEVVMETLELPELRRILQSVDGAPPTGAVSTTTTTTPSIEYAAVMAFLANVFKNESLRSHVSALFTMGPSPAAPSHSDGKGSPSSRKEGEGGARSTGSLLPEILSHAKDRVEVWRCIVHISRLYPALIQQHFHELVRVSTDVVNALVAQEEQRARLFRLAREEVNRSGQGPSGSSRIGDGEGKEVEAPPAAALPPPPPYGEGNTAPPPSAPGAHVDPLRLGDNSSSNTGAGATASTGPAAAAMQITVSAEAFAECLRAWLHFMGYVWQAFDINPDDPVLRPESRSERATPAQKDVVFRHIVYPAVTRLGGTGDSGEVRIMTLRCLAQMGNDFFRDSREVTPAVREELVRFVKSAAADWNEKLRAEGLSTMGMWAWQYPSMDQYGPAFVEVAVHVLATDTDPNTRAKAAFALANLTCRLGDDTSVTRHSVEHMTTLCNTAMQAVADSDHGVQAQGVRIICHLLQTLEFGELIAELDPSSTLMTMYMSNRPLAGKLTLPSRAFDTAPAFQTRVAHDNSHASNSADAGLMNRNNGGPALGAEALRGLASNDTGHGNGDIIPARPDGPGAASRLVGGQDTEPPIECVAEGFLRVLHFIVSNTQIEAKRRWNAAYSLGEALAREVVFESEPETAMDCVYALMNAVVHDRFFKVRTQAAVALAKVSPDCLAGRYTTDDMSAKVVRSLCVALGNSRSTENFTQYKEQGALIEALRASLARVMTSATPTKDVDRVFTEYKALLEQEKLL